MFTEEEKFINSFSTTSQSSGFLGSFIASLEYGTQWFYSFISGV